ncbi:hypothetical protein CDAR_104781 [Caerostris darwini]|uniref:Secreted protein n=1 Tax=Caerostris darwini TaxID=1538125 RepID=A0AAV4W653_9ARAC|nr:hypothetical protein CDAR_104781 [Caerostris darwini]
MRRSGRGRREDLAFCSWASLCILACCCYGYHQSYVRLASAGFSVRSWLSSFLQFCCDRSELVREKGEVRPMDTVPKITDSDGDTSRAEFRIGCCVSIQY